MCSLVCTPIRGKQKMGSGHTGAGAEATLTAELLVSLVRGTHDGQYVHCKCLQHGVSQTA